MIFDRQSHITTISMCGLLVALILFALRAEGMFSLEEALQVQARGAEFESLFVIWKYINGQEIYRDPTLIPYTLSAYNWLFYVLYGELAGAVQSVLSLGDAWLPTICHALTVVIAGIGALLLYLSAINILDLGASGGRLAAAIAAVFFFFGPLPGFWTFAPAPDLLAVISGILTLWIFIRTYEARPLATVLWVCLFVYVTWSFKQNHLYVPAAIGLSLLWRRKWRDAAILAVVPFCAIGVTAWIGGPEYYRQLNLGNYVVVQMTIAEWWRNFFNFSVKLLPYLLLTFSGVIAVFSSQHVRRAVGKDLSDRPQLIVLVTGLGVSFTEAFLTGAVVGAGENHYFMGGVFSILAAIYFFERLAISELVRKWLAISFAAGWLLNIAAVGTVLAGWQGAISTEFRHEQRMGNLHCLEGLSESIFVDDSHLMLPWMVPAKEHYVLSYSYLSDRAAGLDKEQGGVGGLIDAGRFEYLAILSWRNGAYDGSDLARYNKVRTCASVDIFVRNDLPNAG